MAGEKTTVCVTGGSGFIASWLVAALLNRGYTVRASVRDLNDPKRTDHLLALDGAAERLTLFKADLMDDGSFDDGINGCDGVFHCASPFFIHTTNPQEELIEPAVKGTLNVLSSCAKAASVKRVVLTSSEASMTFNRTQRTPETVIDETWWSDADYCREKKMWYMLSKTLAETAAWEFAKQKGIDLVSINPASVIGAMLQPTVKTSCSQVLSLVGAETCGNAAYGWVHVKDVVEAHVLAYEKPEATGRYYVVERCAHRLEIAGILAQLYPDMKFPTKCGDGKAAVGGVGVSTRRAKELGLTFTPLEEALKDTMQSFKEKGLLN